MLVLSRKKDEVILIDGGIEITVVEVRGDKVRLGIKAPETTAVHRKEVAESIAQALGHIDGTTSLANRGHSRKMA